VTAFMGQEEVSNGRKLMLVVTSLSLAGGAEMQVLKIAMGLKQRGWDVEIVSMMTPTPPAPDFTGTGIRVYDLGMRRGVPDPAAVMRFRAILRHSRPDVVHSHMTHANLLARVTRPFAEMPVLICTLHGYKMYSVKSTACGMREVAHRLTDRFADMTTAVCQAAADRYARAKVVSKGRLMVIPNGIWPSLYRPDERRRAIERRNLNLRDEFVWLAAGRLEMVKDYDAMLRAFAGALAGDVPQILLIAGDGSLRQTLERTAEDLGVAPMVRFLGFRPDISNLMRAADAYVMSSIFEGMPLALLEAGASELPIVATRVGGNAETLIEGRSGLLVPAQNPAELGRAMCCVAGMSVEERRAMGRAGGEFVKGKYSLDVILDRWEQLYRQVAGWEFGSLARKAV
jgi:glycosyltransferase involved in cell wall biosynthesis